jgi:hypothetical protein
MLSPACGGGVQGAVVTRRLARGTRSRAPRRYSNPREAPSPVSASRISLPSTSVSAASIRSSIDAVLRSVSRGRPCHAPAHALGRAASRRRRASAQASFGSARFPGASAARTCLPLPLSPIEYSTARDPCQLSPACGRATLATDGPVTQRLEQRTHNPLVPGSNPGGPTSESLLMALWCCQASGGHKRRGNRRGNHVPADATMCPANSSSTSLARPKFGTRANRRATRREPTTSGVTRRARARLAASQRRALLARPARTQRAGAALPDRGAARCLGRFALERTSRSSSSSSRPPPSSPSEPAQTPQSTASNGSPRNRLAAAPCPARPGPIQPLTHFDNLLGVTGSRVRLRRRPEQIVFVSAKSASPVVAPWLAV